VMRAVIRDCEYSRRDLSVKDQGSSADPEENEPYLCSRIIADEVGSAPPSRKNYASDR